MVQFLKVPVNGNIKRIVKITNLWPEFFNIQNSCIKPVLSISRRRHVLRPD